MKAIRLKVEGLQLQGKSCRAFIDTLRLDSWRNESQRDGGKAELQCEIVPVLILLLFRYTFIHTFLEIGKKGIIQEGTKASGILNVKAEVKLSNIM